MERDIKNDQNLLKKSLIACKRVVKYSLLFASLINLSIICIQLFSLQVIDKIIITQNGNIILMLSITLVLTLLAFLIIMGIRMFVMLKIKRWLEKKLSETLFLDRKNLSLNSKTIVTNKQLRDLQTIQVFMSPFSGLVSIMDTPWSIIITIVLSILHPSLGFLVITAGATLIILSIIIDRSTKPLIANNNYDFIKNMRQVDQSEENNKILENKKDIILFWQYKNCKITKTKNLVMQLIKLVVVILTIIFTIFLVIQGQVTAGTVCASFLLVYVALSPFASAINSWKEFMRLTSM